MDDYRPFGRISKHYNIHNNPVVLVDPDGMGDYYNKAGRWLGNDGRKDNIAYLADAVSKDKTGRNHLLGKKLTYSPAIQGYWKGMVLYNSSAAYGGTIFWRPVSNFIIKGVNLNRNFRNVNGSKNKTL